MRTKFILLAIAVLTFLHAGCATSFHAGGRKVGVDAGAAVGPAAVPVVTHGEPVPTLPPPEAK